MGFEPLKTDEETTPEKLYRRDMDSAMLFGCTGFVTASLSCYILAIWPHFVYHSTHLTSTLVITSTIGLIPTLLLGIGLTRKYGLAGGAGFFGGALASAVFLYLRLKQVMIFIGIDNAPQPEYPREFLWLMPGIWVLICLLAIILVIPKDELRMDANPMRSTEETKTSQNP